MKSVAGWDQVGVMLHVLLFKNAQQLCGDAHGQQCINHILSRTKFVKNAESCGESVPLDNSTIPQMQLTVLEHPQAQWVCEAAHCQC